MGRRGLRVRLEHNVTEVRQRLIADSCDVRIYPDGAHSAPRRIGVHPTAESGCVYASGSPGSPDGDASLCRAAYWDQRDGPPRLHAIERSALLSVAGSSMHRPILGGYFLRRQCRPSQPMSTQASGVETA
jgi:hypothetical protein